MKSLLLITFTLAWSVVTGADSPTPPADGGGTSASKPADKGVLSDPRLPPLVDKARQAYPDARKKFAAGLPRGDKFLIRAQVKDPAGVTDIAVVRVRTIIDGIIKGSVYTAPKKATGFAFGQACDVPEGELLDWVISKTDGTEEGDFMGHILGKVQ